MNPHDLLLRTDDLPRFVARREGAVGAKASAVGTGVRRRLDKEQAAAFGPLAALARDPDVTDIFVNGSAGVWADRGRGAVREWSVILAELEARELAVRLIATGGRHIDETSPCVDVRLYDGIRVHAILPPVSPAGTLISVRLPRLDPMTVDTLAETGFFDTVPMRVVQRLVEERANLLITGAGGSGKTTTLAALLALASPTDRIIAIEDVAELRVNHPHFLSLEARQANLEGAGEVGLPRLVREALRMRPDRLVVGECRGAEVRDLLAALNTGHDGGAGTVHANSLADVPARLEALGALAGLDAAAVARQTVSAVQVVFHLERNRDHRRIAQMGRFVLDGSDRLAIEAVIGDGPSQVG